MYVTPQVKARVVAKLQDGIARAEKAYGQKFSMPVVTYDLRGRTAGTANYVKWHINLNAVLLMENVDEFLERTVPHELAHLITDRVYPEAHERKLVLKSGMRLTYKRAKRDVHGPRWQSVCRTLGMTDVTRCHSYDVTNSKVVKSNSRQIEWKCTRCGTVLKLSPKMSAQLDAAPTSRWHKPCRGFRLERVVATSVQVDLTKYGAVALANGPKPVVRVQVAPPASTVSKIEQCKKLYLKYSMLSRAEIIAKFIGEAECTQAGAATYYATCKKLYG